MFSLSSRSYNESRHGFRPRKQLMNYEFQLRSIQSCQKEAEKRTSAHFLGGGNDSDTLMLCEEKVLAYKWELLRIQRDLGQSHLSRTTLSKSMRISTETIFLGRVEELCCCKITTKNKIQRYEL